MSDKYNPDKPWHLTQKGMNQMGEDAGKAYAETLAQMPPMERAVRALFKLDFPFGADFDHYMSPLLREKYEAQVRAVLEVFELEA